MQFPSRNPRSCTKTRTHCRQPTVSRGRNVPRKRSTRGNSNHGSILRQFGRYYVRGTCTRTPCEYWHPPSANPIKVKRVVKLETSVCFHIIRLMNNQIKSHKQSHFIGLCITRFRCGETRCRKSWNQFKGYDSRSLRYVNAASAPNDNPRTPNVHISGPRRFKHHQKSTKGPPREGEKKENCGGRSGKKREILGSPPFGETPFGVALYLGLGLHPSGPTLRGPTIQGPHPFVVQKIQHPKIGRSRNWPKSKLAEVEIGRSRNWPKSITLHSSTTVDVI